MITGYNRNIYSGYVTLIDYKNRIGFANRINRPYQRDLHIRPEVIGEQVFYHLKEGDQIRFQIVTFRNKRTVKIV